MKEKSLTTSDEVHGQYRSFKRIWDEEGTDMQGYQAFREQSQTTPKCKYHAYSVAFMLCIGS
jgi:hypothetical protein